MMYDRATVLAQLIQEMMGAPLAMDKLAVTGSSQALVEACKASLGDLAGKCEVAPKNLGVDFAPGKHRRQPGHGRTRRKRFAAVRPRVQKLLKMKGARHLKARVYFSGVQASAQYGGEVLGHTPKEIHFLRRSGAK
eukprot:1204497-Pyramimonas_sp.AAC.1